MTRGDSCSCSVEDEQQSVHHRETSCKGSSRPDDAVTLVWSVEDEMAFTQLVSRTVTTSTTGFLVVLHFQYGVHSRYIIDVCTPYIPRLHHTHSFICIKSTLHLCVLSR